MLDSAPITEELAPSMQQEHPFPSLHGLGGRQLINPLKHCMIYSPWWLQCSTQAGKERQADWLGISQPVMSSWPGVWTGPAQHIQVFSAGSIFSSSCFLTRPRGSTLIHPPLYGYMLQSPTSTRAESTGISPLRPAASSPCECALHSCQRFTSPTQILWLPQKQYNKEPSVTSQRDLLLIFGKSFEKMPMCHTNYTTGNRRKGPKGALRCPHGAVFSAVTWA